MLDLRFVVENIGLVVQKLSKRNGDFTYLYEVVELSNKRKDIILSVEAKKALRNEASKKIGELKRQKLDATSILNEVAHLGDEIKTLDDELKLIEDKIQWILSITPNIPNDSVPEGKDDSFNVEIKKVGTPRVFDFEVKDHIALGESLGILDFERAAKITGTRFVVDKG
jgi:seryl-tRNA synthetase